MSGLIYDTATLGTPTNSIVFNNFSVSPVYRALRRTPTKREMRDYDLPLPEGSGIADYQSFIGKEYFVIEGVMYPGNEDEFYQARANLRKLASLEVSLTDGSSDQGYVPYKWTEGSTAKQMMVKVVYCDMQENTRQGIVQPFKLYCKVKYPVIIGQIPVTATLNSNSASTATSGGAVIPSYIPMAIGRTGTSGTKFPITYPVVYGASAAVGGGTVTNIGDLPAWPTIVIYGPINKPRVANQTTGEYIELDYSLGTSDSAILTYDQDSLSFVSGNLNIYGKMTAGSIPFRVKPGINNFALSGSSMGTGSYATVSFYPTWPIS
jgi:hypothetical protein